MLRFETLNRQLAEAHMAELLAIIKDEPHEYWDASHFMHELPNKWKRSIIAFDDEYVAGFIIANDRTASNTHINKFMVAPQLRGKGLGASLLRAFWEGLPNAIAEITLKVYSDNLRAQQFYRAQGFYHLVSTGKLNQMIKIIGPQGAVAVHQPNFMPWLGYFHKMVQSSVFILLDDVQFTKNSYINRVKYCSEGRESWLTVPVKDSGLETYINDILLHDFPRHSKKILKTMYFSYLKAPHFNSVYPFIEELLNMPFTHLAELNIELIKMIHEKLNLSSRLLRSSQMLPVMERKDATDRLIELCKLCRSDLYLSGSGGFNYQDVERFGNQKIQLKPSAFKSLEYPQAKSAAFLPNLSTIDALFNIGFEGTAELLKSGSGR